MKKITTDIINDYKRYLIEEEKSNNTISKYIRDIEEFAKWLTNKHLEKIVVLDYKKLLTEEYAPSSVNSKLVVFTSNYIMI